LRIILTFIFVFLLSIHPLFPQSNIDKIIFKGLEKTDESYLRYFIKSEENTAFDSLKVDSDIQRLHNLRLFSEVSVQITHSERGKTIEFRCKELFTLLPIISFGGVSDNFWFQVGALDYNLTGRGHTFGGYYRYYDRHSFALFLKAPFLFSRHWGIVADFAKFSTLEPAHFTGGVVNYKVDRWNFTSSFVYNFSIYNRIEFGGGYLMESYTRNDFPQGRILPVAAYREFSKYLLQMMMGNDYLNYNYQYVSGFANDLNLESVTTIGYDDFFYKILNISRLFFRLGGEGNLGFRLRLGISTNKDSPFVPFVLDNYINVRGSGNRVSRGTAEMTINSEYRQTLYDNYLFAIQGVVFMDMSAWRPAAGSFSQMFTDNYNVTFGGFGLRLFFKQFYNFIIRVDYGISVTGNKGRGFVFGAGQYF
jgi:outer membrane protein assembly factor BamA